MSKSVSVKWARSPAERDYPAAASYLGLTAAAALVKDLTAPTLGALAAVAAAYILRGPGGGPSGTRAAQGTLRPPASNIAKP